MHATVKADRQVDWRSLKVLLLWGVVYVVARAALELETLGWWSRLAIAIAPVPAFAWVLWSIARGVSAMDELERRIQLQALAFAFPLALLLIMTLGLLEIAIGLNPDDWSYRHVWPLFVIFYLAGVVRAKRRYE
jgi:hypothetical protein